MEASWLFNDLFILKPACYFQNAIETKSTRQQQNESKRKHRICSEKMLSEREMSQNILMKFSKYLRCSMWIQPGWLTSKNRIFQLCVENIQRFFFFVGMCLCSKTCKWASAVATTARWFFLEVTNQIIAWHLHIKPKMAKPFFRWGKDDLSCGLYVRLVQYFMQSIFDKSLEFDLHIIHVLV